MGQELLVEAIGRRVGPPFFEIELGGQKGGFRLRVRNRVAQVRVGEGAKGGKLRAATFGDEPAQLGIAALAGLVGCLLSGLLLHCCVEGSGSHRRFSS